MALSDTEKRALGRVLLDMRRGRSSSTDLADEFIAGLSFVGLEVVPAIAPYLGAMVQTLRDAGYRVEPPP